MFKTSTPFWDLIAHGVNHGVIRSGEKCPQCKTKTQVTKQQLFLLPVRIDDTHEESADWFIRNAVPIDDLAQVPVGGRIAHTYIRQCPSCGHKIVYLEDALVVRGQESVRSYSYYEFDEIRELFEK